MNARKVSRQPLNAVLLANFYITLFLMLLATAWMSTEYPGSKAEADAELRCRTQVYGGIFGILLIGLGLYVLGVWGALLIMWGISFLALIFKQPF